MKRIHWNQEAKQAIAYRSFELVTKGMNDLQAVRKAMSEELPSDQQRDIYAISVVSKWLFPMWDEIRESGASRFAEQRVNPVEIPDVMPEQAPALSLQDVSVAALVGELVSRMERAMDPAVWEERIRVQVNACLDRRLPGILPADPMDRPKVEPVKPEPEEPTKAAKPRVLVIGLLPKQQNEIGKRFPNVSFHHVGGDASENRVRSLAANMDLTIRTHWSNGMDLKRIPRVLNVQGSMSSIYRQLEQWMADRSK